MTSSNVISWSEILSNTYKNIPDIFQKTPLEDIEKIKQLLRSLNDYLQLVERGILDYDKQIETCLINIIIKEDMNEKIKNLSFDMLKHCYRIYYKQNSSDRERLCETDIPSYSLKNDLTGIVLSRNDKWITLAIQSPTHSPGAQKLSIEELGPLGYRLKPGMEIALRFTGKVHIINVTEEMELRRINTGLESQSNPDILPVEEKSERAPNELWKYIIQEKEDKGMKNISPITNPAFLTYLAKEEELLRENRGKYVWIVKDEIKEINENMRALLQKAELEGCDPNETIVRKIQKDAEYTYEG